jgi:signal transduction histidine kinase
VVAVSDDGQGIPPEQLSHLFERHWQRPGSERLGFGLGLFIVKGIVEGHGGRIWVKSRVGAGTTFYFTIPRDMS